MRKSHAALWASVMMFALMLAPANDARADDDLFDPVGIFLTWQRDPTTTMSIDWQTLPDEQRDTIVQYRPLDGGDWAEADGDTRPFPFSDRTVHRVELTGLEPGTEYEFRFGDDSRTLRFRTMPAELDRPLRFGMGGDTNPGGFMRRTNWQVLRYDVDFIVWGGDLSYANGEEGSLHRWYHWFESNRHSLVTDDGRVVPVVLSIGNHEVRGGYWRGDGESAADWREDRAPYFYALFAFPGQPGYNVLDFGDYLSLISLDSAHTNRIDGRQTEWLEEILAERAGQVRHIIPFYHVPAFPSVRVYDGGNSEAVRDHWVPLFEQHGVRLAFENHDHAYKRTPPIRNEEIDEENGIVYMGDGAWGVGIRDVHPPEETWYLERAEGIRHGIVVTLDGDEHHALVIASDHGYDGEIVDEYPEDFPDALRLDPEVWIARPDLPMREVESVRDDEEAEVEVVQSITLPEEGWRFRLDPQRRGYPGGWHQPDYDDAGWDEFETGRHWTPADEYRNYAGSAWYRRTIELPEQPGGASPDELDAVEIVFDGVDEMAWVWVNGEFVGQHAIGPEGWNVAFALPVADVVKWGEENQITILAENTQDGGGVHDEIRIEALRVETGR